MSAVPADLELGSTYTQEDIESAFNTRFGYHIPGINPRRDSQDRRYILVFAREDGPYGDSVTKGEFEYIGEGRSGDQSASSPGNSVLIDAVSENIPIHFFYQPADATGWEYQGLISVLGYRREHRDGREVIVFEMHHL